MRRRSRPPDRILDPGRTPAKLQAHLGRAAAAHRRPRRRCPPTGTWLGVVAAHPVADVDGPWPTGRVAGRDPPRLLLGAAGGALELVEIRPPGGRANGRRRTGCAAAPIRRLTDFAVGG